MADLRNDFVGIKSPNPFWLASAPPTDKAYNVERAFKAGWGGVVWKTLGEEGPPVVNVNGPRYGAIWGADRRLLGLNNIELITDRQLQLNLQEIKQVKKNWPDRALVVSIMVPCDEESWKAILPLVEAIEARLAELTVAEVVSTLEAVEVPVGPIYSLDQVFEDPQTQHLNLRRTIEHPKAGSISVTGFPWQLSETPAEVRLPPPLLGEHTDAVLAELGYDDASIAKLHEDGAV